MTERYDIAIIGAGHNGLVCAAYLAKAGRKVVVLERAEQVGGTAVTREFAPGFRVSAGAHILHMLQPKIIRDLKLDSHGLDAAGPAIPTTALGSGGDHIVLNNRSVAGGRLSVADKTAYSDFTQRMGRLAAILAPQLLKTPPRLANVGIGNTLQLAGLGWDLRFGLGKRRMREFLRIIGMNIHGLLDEHFESEALKGAIAFDAILGTTMEPRMPGTVMSYLYRLAGGLGCQTVLPKGGMGSVTAALAACANGFGAEIRTGVPVEKVIMEDGVAVGAALEGGREFRAKVVISNADPKTTFLDLVGARHLEAGFAHRISMLRNLGRTAKLHMALDGLPAFSGLTEGALSGRMVIAPSRRYLEEAFDPAKYGKSPERPALEFIIPTLSDPSLAPDGKHVLSAIAQFVPFTPKVGWKDGKETFVADVIETLSAFAPDLEGKISTTECLAPPDIEREFGMTGGHWHHGELALDHIYMLRPTYGASRYQTPVDGLYLCGAGAHPGGGVMGAAGHNAAQVIMGGNS